MDIYIRDSIRKVKLRLFPFVYMCVNWERLVPNFSSGLCGPPQGTSAFHGSTVIKPAFYSTLHSKPSLREGRETLDTQYTLSVPNIQSAIKEMTVDY